MLLLQFLNSEQQFHLRIARRKRIDLVDLHATIDDIVIEYLRHTEFRTHQ